MISVEEALGLIDKYRPNYGAVQRSLLDANGYALAQNVLARFTQPPFPTSIMDGYALRKKDLFDKLTVVGESRAGKPFDGVIGEKEAVRIFTGATLPTGADCVEIQEHAVRDGETLSFPKQSKNRNYIRAVGSDFISGDLLFEGSTRITPRVISALASANVASVTVNQKPTIALLRGGDELRPVGSALQPGQIIDSNGPSLIALLTGWGFDVSDLGLVADDPDKIKDRLSNCEADIIIPVGGASVGDYDFMKAAFLGLGFKPVFEKVAIKPGKPVWLSHRSALGNRRGQVVLGLPGNSHSVFVCAHLFLSHLLRRVVDWKVYQLGADLPPNGARERFIRAVIDRNAKVSPVYTNNGLTVSIALTEVLIRRAPFADGLEAGQCVECLHINY